ncbi:MAG: yidC [Bacteroidetes bacterium]|nr:yidC [Bacteroidota bacterium]
MDKQSVLGFVLIGLILIVWMWIQTPTTPPPRTAPADSAAAHPVQPVHRDTTPAVPAAVPEKGKADTSVAALGRFFAGAAGGTEKILVIKTDLYTAEITTRGGLIRKWELQNYLTWDKLPVQLVEYDRGGDYSMLFTSSDGKLINTRNLYFNADFPAWKTIMLTGESAFSIDLVLRVDAGHSITKRFTFTNGKYSFDTEFLMQGMDQVISNFEYQIVWEHGLRYAEHNSVDESSFAMAYVYSGGELAELDATSIGEPVRQDINGSTDWVSTQTKYFAVVMMPEPGKCQGAYLEGTKSQQPNSGEKETYALALKMPLKGAALESAKVTVFMGPLDYDLIQGYGRGLDKIVSLGAAWIIRPISEYVMIPILKLLRWLIPNFGVVIIVFSIIIKIALHPLTKTSMSSMKKMQALTPMMTEVREKYKDDPQKMNTAIMNLYKDYGVNPAAGCLPLLLQMPILFALYSVFRSSIELRQASFVGWITDLSIPDTILTLPFAIPLFGITDISGLALAMGITMFIQQKMTVTDPRQKTMVWMMPILMTLMFNSLPSGLNLYYFVFNLLSIGQQVWINKQHGDEPLRKVERKRKSGGILDRLTKDMPKLKQ